VRRAALPQLEGARCRGTPPRAAGALGNAGVDYSPETALQQRGWVKVKHPNYWRRDSEREAMARKHERWAGQLISPIVG
jgi:hypothetical protein